MRHVGHQAAVMAAKVILAVSLVAFGSSKGYSQATPAPVSPEMSRTLEQAAISGPRALLQALDLILQRNPALAATPAAAAALARAATLPIRNFEGANVPIYREVAARIIAAAPAAARAEVSRTVAEQVRQVALTDPMVREPLAGDVEALTRQARREAAQATPSRGFPVDSFTLYPEMQVSEYYDNNIFATKTNERNDFVTVLSPQIYVGSNWKKDSLNFQAHTDVTRYDEHTSEDSTDYWFSSEGQYDLTDTTNAFGGALYGQWHEDRESPDEVVGGLKPTVYHELRGYGGVSHRIGAATVKVGGTWERLTFNDTPIAGGTFFNGDRDRNDVTAGVRTSYRLNAIFEPYLDASYDGRTYRLATDQFGYHRDSKGYRLLAGTNVALSGVLVGEVYGGYLRQNYDDPALTDVSVPGFGGNVRWTVTDNVLFSAWADRSIQETTIIGASSYVYSGVGATLDYNITKALVFTVRGAFGRSAFQGVTRADNDYDTGFSVRYNFIDNLYLATDYRFQRRISNSSAFDYARHQVFVRAGVNF